jgi:AsmA protein
MRPRQSFWKWLLAGLLAVIAVGFVLLLLRPAGPPSNLRNQVEASLSDWTGGTVTLQKPLQVRYLPPSIEGGFKLSDAEKLPSVRSVTAPKFRLTLSLPDLLLGKVSLRSLRLDKPTLTLKAGHDDRTAKTVLGQLTSFVAGAPLENIRIHQGVVEPASGQPALSELDLRLNTRGQLGALEAVGAFVFNGENVNFSMDRGRTREAEAGQSAPLTLKVTSAPLTARFSGTMELGEELGGEGRLEATLPDIRRFLAWVGVALPEGESLKDASASGRVHWLGSTLTFDDGTFEFDGNEAVGLMALTAGARPRIDGTLAFGTLSLDPYLTGEPAAGPDASLFDWVLLKYLDADLRISAAEVSAGKLQLGGGGITINAKNGAISSEIGALEVCGGHAEGRFDLDLTSPRVEAALAGSLADVAIDTCRQSLGMIVPITGSGTVKADMSTGGTTHDELIRGLAGTVVVTAEDGTLPIDLSTLLAKPDAEATGWSEDAVTPYSELNADCSLSAGHLWCQSFRMTTGDKPVSGAGGLDIARQTLDWDLQMPDSEVHLDPAVSVAKPQPGITIHGSLTTPEMARAPASEQETAAPEPDTEKQ